MSSKSTNSYDFEKAEFKISLVEYKIRKYLKAVDSPLNDISFVRTNGVSECL
ncbi:MAG: hypothetical protein IPL20_03215 [Saprospiraceae bacterium]|nr:hypothetical protein [Saprospiraceae bacterium]